MQSRCDSVFLAALLDPKGSVTLGFAASKTQRDRTQDKPVFHIIHRKATFYPLFQPSFILAAGDT